MRIASLLKLGPILAANLLVLGKTMINAFANGNSFDYMKPIRHALPVTDPFTHLSDEIILQVLKWLPKKTLLRCALINKRFGCLVRDETLWTRLDLGCKVLHNGILAEILSRGVVILRLAQTTIDDDVLNKSFLSNCGDFETKLQYLDLSMARISVEGLTQLLKRCKLLKKLSLEHVPLSDSVCEQIGHNTSLEALNLALCDGISLYAIQLMFQKLQKIQILNLSWTSLSAESLEMFCDTITPNVLRLNISGCRKTMTDQILTTLVTRCSELRELDLSDCNMLSSDSIKILTRLQNLEYVSLSRCYKMSNQSYLELRDIKSLQYLDVFGTLSDQAMDILVRSFHPVGINKFIHSAVARPTVGTRRTSIWGLRTRN